MTVDEIMRIVEENGFNVTLTGGDPLYSLPQIIPLVEAITKAGYKVWLYTGFTFEQILGMEDVDRLLPMLESIVDGPFEADKRDLSLRFRGSSNQRIIDVRSTLAAGSVKTFDY